MSKVEQNSSLTPLLDDDYDTFLEENDDTTAFRTPFDSQLQKLLRRETELRLRIDELLEEIAELEAITRKQQQQKEQDEVKEGVQKSGQAGEPNNNKSKSAVYERL